MGGNKTLKIAALLILLFCANTMSSCKDKVEKESTKKMSTDQIWIHIIESDGISGATALTDANSMYWLSPEEKLKHLLDSNNHMLDTLPLYKLAEYLYQDLPRATFHKRNEEN